MSKFEYGGVALTDTRGHLNQVGRVWVKLAWLGVLNQFMVHPTFSWSVEAVAEEARCREDVAADTLRAAAEHDIVRRSKVRYGDRTRWTYTTTDKTWELYSLATLEGLCEPVKNERKAEKATGLAARVGLITGLERDVFVQLARRTTGNEVRSTAREISGWLEEGYEVLGLDRGPVHHTSVVRALKRLEDRKLIAMQAGKGRTPSRFWVALDEDDVEALAQLMQPDAPEQQPDAPLMQG